ncbi:hypothetical protein QFZ81_001025 [Paenibacillus sp. V4I9]|uniref:copper amine oxidase N-terminal domain-containing protein n=1 Tax=Paenibacillus sp. V4I9 TaxID=3042308 RepID=UPI002786C5FA|nr:copper amine oxidase N-terminal domain-containing protein [Paenibacillus sp. V4I9]MDQ0885937.1 hypothetical protein [Paenibacillus sp. V4I9]
MFKKIAVTIVATTIILSTALTNTSVHASNVTNDLRMIPVIVNGQKVRFPDTEPYIDANGRTLVPVRFVSEKLGGTVTWDDIKKVVTVKNGSKTISLPLGSNVATVDGQAVTLDTTAVLTEGRTMVPLRFVSEALSSEVVWDEGAHSVKVTDVSYKDKVSNGSVTLDAWGRELSKTWDAKWNLLTDTSKEFYDLPQYTDTYKWYNHKEFIEKVPQWTYKDAIDGWSERVRKYYMNQLNIDYRTINEDDFIKNTVDNMQFASSYFRSQEVAAIKTFLKWVQDNHVIAKGYADPEPSTVYYVTLFPIIRTNFKFMIISADDTSQTFMDNTQVGSASESIPLTKGVWYVGYTDIGLFTNYGNHQEEHFALKANENMFQKNHYHYERITE